ncbi:MAG TPA: choice-of-anchor Q domain-containing protein [Kiritimatiellia bacterium]|nr:choice-of-anchor Q domain-containing protein [Kiritimatiellia bacterium]HRZ12796.1 choice-of-anchor Q domain-containing protein [Kiritimatiellia bacterium]HSA18252.1 choice-of-anchor Q domain-containing protein [Kiritimatiellia bacterium]
MKMRALFALLAAWGLCGHATVTYATTYYVRAGAAGGGTSWADARGNLQGAIEACAASGGGEVWVAAGTYYPTLTPNGGSGTREVHFSLRNGVTVYGGFPATGSPTMALRDPENYPTICSGAIGDPDDFDNVYHLFYHPTLAALDETAVLDGFRIEDGRADGVSDDEGAGMYNEWCSPTIRNCVYTRCYASNCGGAMHNAYSSPRIQGCAFDDNRSGAAAGAIRFIRGSPVIQDCVFTNNVAESYGGALQNMNTTLLVSNCVFANNRATGEMPISHGGAMCSQDSFITVVSSLFKRNAADLGGALAELAGSTHHYVRCTFIYNHSSSDGGAFYGLRAPDVRLTECVLKDNLADYGNGGAIYANDSSVTAISCALDGNEASEGGGLFCDEGSEALIANSIVSGNVADWAGGSGIHIHWYATCTFVNGVVYGNRTYEHDGGAGVYICSANQSYFYNSIIRGNRDNDDEYVNFSICDELAWPGVAFCNATYDGGVFPGSGNSSADVQFMDVGDPDGADDLWLTADDGYRLREDSPCREAGTVEALPADLTDVDGDGDTAEDIPLDAIRHLRVQGARVDMGAYEFGSAVQPTYSVDFVLGAHGLRTGGGALHQDVVEDHATVAPEVIGIDGWMFTGWDADFSRVTADLTVNAQYSLTAHTVRFDLGAHGARVGGGELVQNVPHGAAAAAPLIRVGVGWYFRDWDTAFDHVTGDLVVHALYQEISIPGDIVYVKAGATSNGSSWAQAMGDLQAAIDFLGDRGAGQVWVAQGTYVPNSWSWGGWTERTVHFALRENVEVYGGFPATGTPGMGDRDWMAHPTICSGDLGALYDYSDNAYHVFQVRGVENAVLDGFVIEWGNANDLESPHSGGGGMRIEYGAPTIVRCAIGDNRARYGGGVYCKYGRSPTFTDCRFSDNAAILKGGGMRNAAGASPDLDACVFHSNEAEWGGGMANDLSYPDLKRCRFEQNTATDWGGALHNAGGYVRMINGLLVQNEAGDGGAVFNSAGLFWAFNTVWHGNRASFSGGALYNEMDADSYLYSSTVTSNTAGSGGGSFSWDADQHVYNSILWGNTGGSFVNMEAAPAVRYSLIQGGYAGGIGVLNQDPVFANPLDPNGADNEWLTADDGLQLQADSIAINFGAASYVTADTMDLDGDADLEEAIPLDAAEGARTVGFRPDLGAYEYPALVTHTVTFNLGVHGHRTGGGALVQEIERHGAADAPVFTTDIGWAFTGWDRAFTDVTAPLAVNATYEFAFETGDICYVRQGATGNGTSWGEATGDLQGAIDAMSSAGGGQVWVAAGAYKPNSFPNGGSGARQQHFSLRNGVAVLGGFPATGDPGFGDRDPDGQLTICTGDIGLSDETSDNTYHVFYHPASAALAAAAVLDGFVIHGGRADGSAPHDSGGGLYNSSCSPTLRHCVFLFNYAQNGGGLYNLSSSPKLTRCRFTMNTAANQGGGMRNYTASSPSLANCVFNGNAATDGGAMYSHSAAPMLVNSVFSGNTASDEGGGMYNSAAAAMVYCSTFEGNTAAVRGGGIYNTSSSPTVENAILWGNIAPAGSNLYDGASSSSMVGNSTVGGGWAAGYNISSADPLFQNASDPDGADNRWATSDDGLRLAIWSPALNAGGNGSIPTDGHDLDDDGNVAETLPIDLAGKARVTDDTVDPGAYEFEVPVHTVTFDLGAHGMRTGGGELVQRVEHGASASAPALDTEEGWAFTGWDRVFDAVTADLLVTAQYEFRTFDVTFDLGARGARVGGGELAQVVGYGSAATAPRLTVADHWYFTGWSAAFDEVTSDLAVAAVYSQILPSGGICYVKQGGTENGSSWDKAMGDLQAAINEMRLAGEGQVWVAAGTYRPNSWPNGGTGDVRAMHFALANDVEVYGGFPAAGNPGMVDRAPAANITLCSGDIGAAGVSTDNVYHVFHHGLEAALEPSAVLDGFHLRHGQATGVFPHNDGGGMLNRASSPTVRNCAFSDNVADWGGGMQNINSSSPLVEDCSFINNQGFWGGAMGNQGGSHPSIYDSVFQGNRATRGAAVYSFEASFQAIADCVFEQNQATENGGALYLDGACGIVSRCEIRGNHAGNSGGGVVLAGNSRLFCSLVAGNSSTMSGAGVYLVTTGRIEYCTIAANVAGKHGGGLHMDGRGVVTASIIYSNSAAAEGPNGHDASALGTYDHCCTTPEVAGAGLVTDPPAFVAPAAGNFRLSAGSPCVDAGPAGAEVVTDLDGRPRPLDGDADGASVLDIGAYELLNADADSDADEMRDGWELEHALNLLDPADAAENPDKDPFTNRDEAIADTDPFDPGSYLRITQLLFMPEPTLFYWPASHRRAYTVCASANLRTAAWSDLPGATRVVPPASGLQSFHLFGRETEPRGECYRLRVSYP